MKVKIREWALDDADALASVVNNTDRRYLRNMGDGIYSLRDAKKYIRLTLDETHRCGNIFRAITLDDKVVGCISVESGKDVSMVDANIGYYIDNDYTHHGVATEAVRLMVDEAFAHLDILRISAYVCTLNEPSMRVLERCGFGRESVMRSAARLGNDVVDVAVYALLREDYIKA